MNSAKTVCSNDDSLALSTTQPDCIIPNRTRFQTTGSTRLAGGWLSMMYSTLLPCGKRASLGCSEHGCRLPSWLRGRMANSEPRGRGFESRLDYRECLMSLDLFARRGLYAHTAVAHLPHASTRLSCCYHQLQRSNKCYVWLLPIRCATLHYLQQAQGNRQSCVSSCGCSREWNVLPESLTSASSIAVFRLALKTYLYHHSYINSSDIQCPTPQKVKAEYQTY